MRTSPIAWIACALALSGAAAPVTIAAETFSIDPAHSVVMFKINHLGVATFYGRFNGLTGEYTFDAASPAGSSFAVSIDAESVDTNNDKRDQHLKSPDFFNSKQFPVLTMKSKSVKKTGEKGLSVTADLSLHGVTKEVAFDLTHVGAGKDPWGGYRSGFETQFTIKRSDFDIRFMPDGLGDEITILVSIEGVRK